MSGVSSNRSGEEEILNTARIFFDRGLRQLDSVFTPGRPVWDKTTVDVLHEHFVAQPDLSSDGFLTKLHRQIGETSDHAKQLTAELLTLNVLPLDSSRAIGKTE